MCRIISRLRKPLVLLILCLLVPKVDSIGLPVFILNTGNYNSHIKYFQQDELLIDSTLHRNLALGVTDGEIDESRIHEALRQDVLFELLETLPKGLDTAESV